MLLFLYVLIVEQKKKCNYCDTNLVYHKESNILICHQCGKNKLLKDNCIKCNSNKFILVRVWLRKVFEEVKKFFKSKNY